MAVQQGRHSTAPNGWTRRHDPGTERADGCAPEAQPMETTPDGAMDERDIAHLLAAAARGDEEAFPALYAATAPALFALSIRMLGRRDAAEDALAEAYSSHLASCRRLSGERCAAAHLHGRHRAKRLRGAIAFG